MKLTTLTLILNIILLTSCNEKKSEELKSANIFWPTDIQKFNLKGDIDNITEHRLYNGDSLYLVDIHSFNNSGMIDEKVSISRYGEPSIFKFKYDKNNRMTFRSANGIWDTLEYNIDSTEIRYFINKKLIQISTFSKTGQLKLNRSWISDNISDSCVYFYNKNRLIKTLTYIENKLKVKQEYKYYDNGDLMEEYWEQDGDTKNASRKIYSYTYDDFNNWIIKTATIDSLIFYTVKREIKYKNSH